MYFFESGKTPRRRHILRREREVLGGGELKLSWEERKAFLEEEWGEQVGGEVQRRWAEVLEAARRDGLGVGRCVREVIA